MMRLLETMNIIAAWNSSKKIVFTKVFLKLVLLFQIHEEWKPMETCAHNPARVSKPKQLTKRQLETHTKEPSFWEWTTGCPINFLPSSAWREQCPRAVISAEVKRMKRLHDLPQNCSSSGRGAETKLSKLQQIDAINVKNDQNMIHVPSPWILKRKIWEHVVWRAERDLQQNPLKWV